MNTARMLKDRTDLPLISVALPVYNGEQHLAEAIDSILSQTFLNFELIIIDDGSTDNSLRILKDYESRDQRIRLISRENRDLVTTLNEIIDMARGKWVARMDQDDIALASRFERQLEWLEQTGADICGSWMQYFGTGDQRIWKTYESDEAIKIDMLFKCPLAHPTVVMRAAPIKQLRYDKAWEKAEDYELWTRAAMAGLKMTNVQEPLLLYRRHKSQISTATYDRQQSRTLEAQKKYWAFMASELGLEAGRLEEFRLFAYSNGTADIQNIKSIFEKIFSQSGKESRRALAQGAARICYRIAVDHPDVVAMLLQMSMHFGVQISFSTRLQLMFIRVLRIRFGGRMFNLLMRLYKSLPGSSIV